ncbi:ATP-binding protein [Streptomyces sp. ISL-10]|uniref:ATP-binding protein n=1 Tax=Streptomyces sp. ISL-10 TaxID=2819172 RepID=UPI001BE54F1B|nr:ATP-binding protein [Streptomyces sp. ISL-10]MBT2368824.1 ATP-binding protein [Streptomyces sp. ISL-10]
MISLPAQACRVGTVRAFVAGLLNRWGVTGPDRDSAVLVVSELAGNAAQHGGSEMTVSVSLSAQDLCIDVVDTGPSTDLPRPRGTDADDEHGRGLGIVEYLAEWIDIRTHPDSWRCGVGLRVARTVAPYASRAA